MPTNADQWKELTFEFNPRQREEFIFGDLAHDWQQRYPKIFDKDDLRLAESQRRLHCHFFEWLAAILLFEKTGYWSLVEQYQFHNHKRKQTVLQKIDSCDLFEAIALPGKAQCPDLLVYAPDFSEWYFCEVKGPSDKIRKNQVLHFQKLAELTGKPVRLIRFRATYVNVSVITE
jgi:hypothetical protein